MKMQCNTVTPSDLAIGQALSACIYAADWIRTREVFEERQEILLSDRALELISFMVGQLYLQGDIEDSINLARYQELLVNARVLGIELAWENFLSL